MLPPIVCDRQKKLLFCPIRKAASSSIQASLGRDFISIAEALPLYDQGYTAFTCWRQPHERLLSLHYGHINPASQGFHTPFLKHGITNDMSFDDFVIACCALQDSMSLDQHLHTAVWPTHFPRMDVHSFDNLSIIFPTYDLQPQNIGASVRRDVNTNVAPRTLARIHTRYSYEYDIYPTLMERTSNT